MSASTSEYLLHDKQPFEVPPVQQQPVQPQSVPKDAITPHSYLALSIIVLIFCGIFNPFTLACTIPATITSAMSYSASTKGDITQGKSLGNCSLVLTVSALVSGLVIMFIGLLIGVLFGVFFGYCGLTPIPDRQSICSRMF